LIKWRLAVDRPYRSEIYSRYIWSFLAVYLKRILLLTPVTANQITVSLAVFGFSGGMLNSVGSDKFFVLGMVFYFVAKLLDNVDGEIARCKNQESALGLYLDRLSHYVIDPAMHIGIGVGLFRMSGNIMPVYSAMVMTLMVIIDESSKDLIYRTCPVVEEHAEKPKSTLAMEGNSFTSSNLIKDLLRLTISNPAFYHIFFLCTVIDCCSSSSFELKIACLYSFSSISILRTGCRVRRRIKHYFKQ